MDAQLLPDCQRLQKALRQFAVLFSTRVNTLLGSGRINLPQYHAMNILYEVRSMRMGELARALGVTMGAATNLIDKLSGGGLVTRERDDQDRRVVNVALTPSGLRAVEGMRVRFAEFVSPVLAEIEPQERAQFLDTGEEIIQLIEKNKTLT